jgi:hypothetical protein
MEGKNVEIFLKTPLFRFKYVEDGKEHQLLENAIRIEGKVVSENAAGIVVKVKDLSNQREKQKKLPFETIFLPFEKIDFVIFI